MSNDAFTDKNSGRIPLCVEEDINQFFDDLDKVAFFSKVRRLDLFILAVAIGYRQKERTPLKNSHGIIRAEYILDNYDALAIIQAIHIDELRKNAQEDKIDDLSEAYRIANEYANTGFLRLKEERGGGGGRGAGAVEAEAKQLSFRAACKEMSMK